MSQALKKMSEVLTRDKILIQEGEELKAYESESGPLEDSSVKLLEDLTKEYTLTQDDVVGLKVLLYRVKHAKLVNAVIPVYCHHPLDRDKIYQAAVRQGLNAKKHEKFTGIAIKFFYKSCKFTGIFFNSGSINCVGVKDVSPQGIQAVYQTLLHYIPILFGEEVASKCKLAFRIANRVISTKIPRSLRLDHLHLLSRAKYWRECKYQTEIFPGLISRMEGSKAKLLFFRTGSLIGTGITSKKLRLQLSENLVLKLANYLECRRNYMSKYQ